MKTILVVTPTSKIIIKVPLFGRIKAEVVKEKELRGQHLDLVIYDELVKKK